LADADAILAHTEALAQSVLSLARPRRPIGPALRKRIGDREGWICRICGEAIDPELRWIQPDRAAIAEHEARTAGWSPTDEAEILAWVGDDPDRAEVVLAWSTGQTVRAWKSSAVRRPSDFTPREWSEAFRPALRGIARSRAAHNDEYGTVEHLVPVSTGGTNAESNLVLAHKRCNTNVGAEGASNAELLEAPGVARIVIREIRLLRDARECDSRLLLRYVGRLAGVRAAAGLPTDGPAPDGAEVRRALAAYTGAYGDMWQARRECMRRLFDLSFTTEGMGLVRYLGAQLREADRKLETLVRPDAIERWHTRRLILSGLLPRAEANPSLLEDLLAEYADMSGQAHDAAWWQARRDEFPDLLPGAFLERSMPQQRDH
jgi:hypothetical protein